MSQPGRIIAIIPARGGSKGIPRKNALRIGGRPLLAHSIVQARQTPAISRIVVSTDDDEIADIAREWGAEVVPRPTEISGDKASSESALVHALDYLKEKEGYEADLIVFLQATSPCRAPGELQKAIEALVRQDADSLLSVGPVHGFVWRVEKDGTTRSFSYDHLNRPRRQDAPEDLIENGSFYIFKPWVLHQLNNRLGGKITLHRMSALDSFQIDEPGDFDLLELIMRHRGVIGPETEDGQTPEVGARSTPNSQSSVNSGQWSLIKLLALDFDGVLTDNRVLVTEDGKEAVLCDRGDGLGLGLLKAAGIKVVIISKEKNPVVTVRCRKLGIECIQGCDNKLAALQQAAASSQWAAAGGLKPTQIAYVGNDINDLECLRWVGLPIAVADSTPEVKATAKWLTAKPGGHGAVREICDTLLRSSAGMPQT